MDNRSAAETIEKNMRCKDKIYCRNKNCEACEYNVEYKDFQEALYCAISALNHLSWEDDYEEERE